MSFTKNYLLWHIDKYGIQPTEFDRVDEFLADEEAESKRAYELKELRNKETQSEIIAASPSVAILLALQRQKIDLADIHWRQFEEIVAELLSNEGYKVTLTRRTKDQGVDILAEKDIPMIGTILSVWQAKKSKNGVGIECVRELADTRNEFKASKGIIVTSSYLTQGAVNRIERDKYILEGVEKADLLKWISHYKQ